VSFANHFMPPMYVQPIRYLQSTPKPSPTSAGACACSSSRTARRSPRSCRATAA
jgi:hypothetical protein